MLDQIKQHEWKKFILAAIIFTVIYILMEIVPSVLSMNKHEYGGKVIDKAVAEQHAIDFAKEQTGLEVISAKVVHQSDKLLNGYLAKETLHEKYEKNYDSQFPADTFQVNIEFGNNEGNGFVYLHMYNERITGWNFILHSEQYLSNEEQLETIHRFLIGEQFKEDELDSGTFDSDGGVTFLPANYVIGESKLQLSTEAVSINGQNIISKYKPVFVAPDDYKSYVKGQDKLGDWLTGVGYVFMSFVLGILAIIYSILYRKHTSFKYGIILTIFFFICYLIMNLGVMDGIIALQGEEPTADGMIAFMGIISVILTIPLAASVYFSIVAGDGLWKAQGRNLWPRLRDQGYGNYVWRSMGLSYLFALILLGLQSIIFWALELLIGTWSSTDVTMSPYNMSMLWLMPVLAWAAAIMEEAVFRFFGIGLFRKWFRHTFAAAIFPTLFWALGHVTYPIYPSTTRLIELMIIGLIFSFIFVRYGFISAMFTHAIFNSITVGISMFMVGSSIDIVSAIFFILLPALIALILKIWSNKKGTKPPITTVHPLEQQ
ncbi:CPBP family intramembrane metalloprotease [Paenibacillus sp. GSMTC-2017]|uniref:CPBP family intramembrane glutamic endopeptidase n=1 Tax=Paenibacillus sp. GSMTC-2017 TaxID=2794350 RepID=UPI0018D804C2|nr:CPBP family intramembrane glutamic endopeptidase [Paenibacillus sp. GSMTC-2017]MBH5319243.1 CPBP family intramembrane metalloprotease [Paenibacillus sp. GSMTC-2017]